MRLLLHIIVPPHRLDRSGLDVYLLDRCIELIYAYLCDRQRCGAGGDGNMGASLLARALLFLEEMLLECHEKILCGAILFLLGFPKIGWSPPSCGGIDYCDVGA